MRDSIGTPGARRLPALPASAPGPDRHPEHFLRPATHRPPRHSLPLAISNSSTLSELAVGRLDSRCKSPDCPPWRPRGSPDRSATVSTPPPLRRTTLLFRDVSFLAREDFLEAVFFCATFLFGAIFLTTALFPFFRFVRLFLFGMPAGSLPSIFVTNPVKSDSRNWGDPPESQFPGIRFSA